jgi:hypothetical protein
VQQSGVDLQVSKKFWKFASPVVLDVAYGFSSHAHQGKVLQVTSAFVQGAQSEREKLLR